MPRSKGGVMSSEQMVRYAKILMERLGGYYPDVRLSIEDGLPKVTSNDGQFQGMGAITVLENYVADAEE